MTSPIEPTDPPTVPEYPQLGDPAFNTKAYTFGSSMAAIVAWIAGAVSNAWNNALAAFEAAAAAVAAAVSASTAASQAVAAANFKGEWPALAALPNPADRALNKPACVKNNGRFWMLLNNLADVATSQPGVSADWTALNVGQVSARIGANTTAVAGVFYIATTPGITLTYAAGSWTADDATGGRNASGGGCFINWGAYTVSGETPEAPMSWPNRGRFNAVYDGSTFA